MNSLTAGKKLANFDARGFLKAGSVNLDAKMWEPYPEWQNKKIIRGNEMGMYKYIKANFEKEYNQREEIYRHRLAQWRNEDAMVKAERPTNLARARALGFKAKKGDYIIVRVRMRRGQRKRPEPMGGRKPGKNIRFLSPGISLQRMAEIRAARKYRNMEVLNSYWVGEDGQKKYFEIILVNPKILQIRKTRAFRGLTSSAMKGRQDINKRLG